MLLTEQMLLVGEENNIIGASRPVLSINTSNDIRKVRPFPTQGNSISPQRILLFEKKQRIGKKDYLVEMSRNKLHMFIIAFLIENPKYFTLQLPMKQAFKLLLDLDNSFDALIDLLYFRHGSLVLPDIFRSQFSPRNMGAAIRTTTNKGFSKYKGFGSNLNSKGTISEATASRPALENEEMPKPLITKPEMPPTNPSPPKESKEPSLPSNSAQKPPIPSQDSSAPPAPTSPNPPAPAPTSTQKKDTYEFDFDA